jgi:AraC family transcriptional regulator
MPARLKPTMSVDAELRVPLAVTQLVRFHVAEPVDRILRDDDDYWLDLSLTPRHNNARACLVEHWAPNRFERLGNMFLLPPREVMRARSDGGPDQTSMLCHLHPEPLRKWFAGELVWTVRRLEAGLDIADENVRRLLLRLAEELRQPGFASAALIELIVAQLAIELGRYGLGVADGPAIGGLAPWRLRLIDERLDDVRDMPTLAELAALCHLSVRQLTRAYRTSRGRSIGDHIAAARIDHAKRLLASHDSIKAIAYALGFASPSAFSFAFRRATGLTPREFRHRSGDRAVKA